MKKSIPIGTVFGKLTVVKHLGAINYNNMYLCKCECGNSREVKLTYLITESKRKVRHCGCECFVPEDHGNKKYTPEMASYRAKAANYISQAKKRKIECTLSYDDIIPIFKSNCYYCNTPPSNIYNVRKRNRVNKKNIHQHAANNSEGYNVLYSGIDRIDNSKGYILGNVVPCCYQCNTAKLNYTLDNFKSWVKNVYNNLNLENYEDTSHK